MESIDFQLYLLLIGCQSQISILNNNKEKRYFSFKKILYFCLQFTVNCKPNEG